MTFQDSLHVLRASVRCNSQMAILTFFKVQNSGISPLLQGKIFYISIVISQEPLHDFAVVTAAIFFLTPWNTSQKRWRVEHIYMLKTWSHSFIIRNRKWTNLSAIDVHAVLFLSHPSWLHIKAQIHPQNWVWNTKLISVLKFLGILPLWISRSVSPGAPWQTADVK